MTNRSGTAVGSAASYAAVSGRESGIVAAAAPRPEVWLRGNVRPAAVATVGVVMASACAAVALAARGASSGAWVAAAGCCAVPLALTAALAWTAARPRLARRGSLLEIRLRPWGSDTVPLDLVECVFPGSQPLADGGRRVGTLVVRFAERAAEWTQRPTFRPWGTWNDGHAVIDGRWCEPLSRETVERIAADLLAAKRAAAERDAG